MRILISSEHDREVLIEEDITSTVILQELEDRVLEIEVSETEIDNWLSSEQVSLKVSESFGETIQIHKGVSDTTRSQSDDDDTFIDLDDRLFHVMTNAGDVPEIDMDIPNVCLDDDTQKYERLRRWTESHPMRWHKLKYEDIASEIGLTLSFVYRHLSECVISAKYCETESEFKQKRAETSHRKIDKKSSTSLRKISDWLNNNEGRWQDMTYIEISTESETSLTAVYKNLPKILLAQGFVSDLFEYQRTRKASKQKRKKVKNREVSYLVEVV